MNSQNKPEEKVIRLSLSWLALGLVGITALGLIGGSLGQQLIDPPLPPLNGPTEKLVTTVQEVVLSPSIAASTLVADNDRSILGIAQTNAAGDATMVATGLVITSDGLVVTPSKVNNANTVAIDHEGNQLKLTLVGTDSIFGLSYWRLTEGVFIPLEIRQKDAPIATELLVMTRSKDTFLNKVDSFRINEYSLPTNETAIGIQKIIKGKKFTDVTLDGSPLLDDEGKISGILINSNLGIALSATTLRESLDRVTNNQHGINPIVTTGITPAYSFKSIGTEEKRQFTITVAAIAPSSPAAVAGIKAGDVITKIGEENVIWSNSFMKGMGEPLPLKLTILRAGEYQTITINKPSAS